MHPRLLQTLLSVLLAATAIGEASAQTSAGYADLVRVFEEFREARTPAPWSAAFDDPAAPGRKNHQYFEIMGSRAIYHDGWMASAFGPRVPWISGIDPATAGRIGQGLPGGPPTPRRPGPPG